MQQLSPRDSQNLAACNYHDCFYLELLVQTLLQLRLNPILSIFFTVHHWFLIWPIIKFANYSWKKTRNSFAVFLYCVCVHEIMWFWKLLYNMSIVCILYILLSVNQAHIWSQFPWNCN